MSKTKVSDVSFLAWISHYHRENGYPPTLREAAKALRVRSCSTVSYRVKALSEKGYIRYKKRTARSLVITPLGYSAFQGN